MASPDREALVALHALAAMPQTHVALISGRSLEDLATLTGAPPGVHLVGSHGSEFDPDFVRTLTEDQSALRDRLASELEKIASTTNGALVEHKPASVAFHYRNARDGEAERALDAVFSGPATLPGVHLRKGKKVVELAVIETNKGAAFRRIRQRVGATAAVFFGDDLTDEDAFQQMTGPDVSVKVGPGDTAARFRIDDTRDVSRMLARLVELRIRWLEGSSATPIERLSMLSDQRTAALVTPEARIVWLCTPRFDAGAIFAELLGGPDAGRFSVAPVSGAPPTSQRYVDNALVLRTEWPDFHVTDYMDVSGGRVIQRAGRTELVRVLEGRGKVVVEFAPRVEFGRVATRLAVRNGGVEVEDTLDPVMLHAPGLDWVISVEGRHQTARAVVDLNGEPVAMTLRYGAGGAPPTHLERDRRKQTLRYWGDWADALHLPGIGDDLVRRSALALRGLVFGPTGAVVAAATTSLPEHLGGVRNWDYRYCWPRDAAIAAMALLKLGSTTEAMRLLDWFLGVIEQSSSPDRVHPVYTVTGGTLGSEAELAELAGYCGSRPVRVGNLAAHQIQLDVLGPVADLVYELAQRGAPLSGEHWRLTEAMANAVVHRWREPDHGIWEIRLERRHHVHSKAMCWTVMDRAIKVADAFAARDMPSWGQIRDEIAADVLENGWSESAQAFTTAYGHDDLDASALLVGLCGLLPPSDERFVKTVDAVREGLLTGPVVRRYTFDDGLPGLEGGFHICTSWLVESLAMLGRVNEARRLFADMCELAGHTGMMPEQYCNATKRSLGNHPQAYSHAGVILSACRIAELRGRS